MHSTEPSPQPWRRAPSMCKLPNDFLTLTSEVKCGFLLKTLEWSYTQGQGFSQETTTQRGGDGHLRAEACEPRAAWSHLQLGGGKIYSKVLVGDTSLLGPRLQTCGSGIEICFMAQNLLLCHSTRQEPTAPSQQDLEAQASCSSSESLNAPLPLLPATPQVLCKRKQFLHQEPAHPSPAGTPHPARMPSITSFSSSSLTLSHPQSLKGSHACMHIQPEGELS